VVEEIFEQSFSAICRLAAIRAATTATLYQLPTDSRQDLQQEALLELWRKRGAYDPGRGTWRTFAELVVANRMVSMVRSMHAHKAGYFREEPIQRADRLPAPVERHDLRIEVRRVLGGVAPFDRTVALCLIGHSAAETGHKLGVSRATVYRVIDRLRVAFTRAGLAPRCQE
jgi:RNA polymerase sigma-70 factor, ECF subfamily